MPNLKKLDEEIDNGTSAVVGHIVLQKQEPMSTEEKAVIVSRVEARIKEIEARFAAYDMRALEKTPEGRIKLAKLQREFIKQLDQARHGQGNGDPALRSQKAQ